MGQYTFWSLRLVLVLLLVQMLTSCSGVKKANHRELSGIKINYDVIAAVPFYSELAIYLPQQYLEPYFFAGNKRVAYGPIVKDSILTVFQQYFRNIKLVDFQSNEKYGLLLAVAPYWSLEGDNLALKFDFKVFDGSQKFLYKSSKQFKERISYDHEEVSFNNVAIRASQLMAVRVMNQLKPTRKKFPAINTMSSISRRDLININSPIRSVTAFSINQKGELLTSASTIRDCDWMDIKVGNETFDVEVIQSNEVLDIAVLSTGVKTSNFLKFRDNNEIQLGEKITSTSFPSKFSVDASPNLALGYITSKNEKAFQFFSPIQPGSNGSALVSAQSEILGMIAKTLNAVISAENPELPQNLNFSLNTKHIKQFLTKYNIEYSVKQEVSSPDTSLKDTLLSTIKLRCY